ncbi:hypothetical protein EZS27_012966 [termite gut metagenome]|uniref:Uncharacterized protein n=1 Tax=termite gut metagenome TaxID=433724 RepID=A0A5J4S067_9ZZZZ
MSSGERQFLFSMSTVLYHIKNLMSVPQNEDGRVKYNNFNIILDEIELCFHPEYQREFVNSLIGYLERLNNSKEYNFNIILSTHSPFILSDIPNCNVMYLKKGNIEPNKEMPETFSANINDILKQSFFLENGFIGEYAKNKINSLLNFLTEVKEKDSKWNEITAQECISLIGEPIIKEQLQTLFNEVFGIKDAKDKEIEVLKIEIERLKTKQ